MKTAILDARGRVTPASSKSHIIHRFFLTSAGGRLGIDFSYGPKQLEDLEKARTLIERSIDLYFEEEAMAQAKAHFKSYLPLNNLITVSVDSPHGHLGAAHRHDPEQFLHVSRHEASPGLVSGDIVAGMWEVTLSLHAIVTDYCEYSLQIWQEEEAAK
ncbi:hypothetical protein [Paenibacillus graminis]|uniref:hypothetical protein n=1 Tax=Paenibacillus graminis TaxID=189425 RepID=UPI002DB937CE|nr:hypothetical protein [Paenibacillus graminis]MEC0171112.1 hypothetical protein [Paenibacillus graminis]